MIEMKGISKSFDGFPALRDLSIHIGKGSIYGLVGTNGSGKTTVIRLLTGVLRPDGGSISFDGEPVLENRDVKARIGYIPDDLSFFGIYNLKEAAAYYKTVYPTWDQDRCTEMTRILDLDEKKRIGNFSKGMQKQAAFILNMCIHPEYLILDEPIDGLDPIIRKVIWKYIINDVTDRSMTVLISSHNLREIEGICDRVGILDHGKVQIERDLDELIADIHKVQLAFPVGTDRERIYQDLHVIHRESSGSVDMLILRNEEEWVRSQVEAHNPLVFDLLPLTLEEIFIYELGGERDEIKDLIY